MKSTSVSSRQGGYRIVVGTGLLEKTGKLAAQVLSGKRVLVISQPGIAKLYLPKVAKALKKAGFELHTHLVADGETAKSKDQLFGIYSKLLDKGFERRDAVLALGGGVVGDLAGFAAATYLRGVPFINVPTTLLAQVDSAIGGKTAINLHEGKNLVGAFYPPKLVISDAAVFKTLPRRELVAALGEVVKYGVIRDAKLFRLLERNAEAILEGDSKLLSKIVDACSRIKAGVVSRDEFETRGERMILNFGHTFGHGFEQALDYKKLLHGEAVAVGMVCAARTAREMKMFKASDCRRVELLIRRLHLPVSVNGLEAEAKRVLSAMTRDKKKKSGKLRFVLPVAIGKVVVRDDAPSTLVKRMILEVGAKP